MIAVNIWIFFFNR